MKNAMKATSSKQGTAKQTKKGAAKTPVTRSKKGTAAAGPSPKFRSMKKKKSAPASASSASPLPAAATPTRNPHTSKNKNKSSSRSTFNKKDASTKEAFVHAPHAGSGSLYDILGVSKDAKTREIILAYRKRARECHPDKNKEKGAKAAFQSIVKAYEILSKPPTREQYDNGTLSPDGCDMRTAYDYVRQRFKPVQPADIEQFSKEYRGSVEEKNDLVHYYTGKDGDMSKIEEEFLLCEVEHIPRLMDLVHTLILEQRIKNRPFFCSTEKLVREKAKRRLRNRGVQSSTFSSSSSTTATAASRPSRLRTTDVCRSRGVAQPAEDSSDLVAMIRGGSNRSQGPPRGGILESLWNLVPEYY